MQDTMPINRRGLFLNTVFFVLGFSVIFSLAGVLLQTVLAHSSQEVTIWLGRIGGTIIIFFGLFLLDLFTPAFLTKSHQLRVTRRFNSQYITSFVFGAAFALGWTPCVSAVLGAILALAATQASSAFVLLLAYTLGIGIPFLIVGLFTSQAEHLIAKAGTWLIYIQYVFGVLLVIMGIFIFVGQLSQIANVEFLTTLLLSLHVGALSGTIQSLTLLNLGLAFLAGLGSFLSPCILPIIPGFLSYLAGTATAGVRRPANSPTTNQL